MFSAKAQDCHKNTPLRCLLQESSIHGVKYLSLTDRPLWERLLWLIIILASAATAAFFVRGVLKRYYLSPVIVSFQTEQTYVSQIPYPAVSVCSVNRFRKSVFFEKLKYAQELREKIKEAEKAGDNSALETLKTEWETVNVYLRAFDHVCQSTDSFTTYLNYSLNETTVNLDGRGMTENYESKIAVVDMLDPHFQAFWDNANQNCKEMIPLCMWEGKPMNCSEVFQSTVVGYGGCCTFNMMPEEFFYRDRPLPPGRTDRRTKPMTIENSEWATFDMDKHILIDDTNPEDAYRDYPRRQSKSGQSSGLSFLLNPEVDEYFCSANCGFGFRIIPHSPVEHPRVKDFGMALSPSSEIFFNVQAELTIADDSIEYLDPETRYCYYSKEKRLERFQQYTQQNCIDECLSRLVFKNCSCARYDLPLPNYERNLTFCEGPSLKCSEAVRIELLKFSERSGCPNCMPSCNRIEYYAQASSMPLRQDPEIWVDNQNKSATWANGKVSVVHVFFGSDSVYSKLRKKLYGTNDLIANIGGILGLFLGMSIIGIVEPAFYLLRLLYFSFCMKPKSQ